MSPLTGLTFNLIIAYIELTFFTANCQLPSAHCIKGLPIFFTLLRFHHVLRPVGIFLGDQCLYSLDKKLKSIAGVVRLNPCIKKEALLFQALTGCPVLKPMLLVPSEVKDTRDDGDEHPQEPDGDSTYQT